MATMKNLLAYFKFDEKTTATTIVDSSNNALTSSSISAGFALNSTQEFFAAACNSGSGRVSLGSPAVLSNWNVSQSLTFMFWFQTSATPATAEVLFANQGTNALQTGVFVGLVSAPATGFNGVYLNFRIGTTTTGASAVTQTIDIFAQTSVNDNTWHFGAVVMDRSYTKAISIYLDGAVQQLGIIKGCGIVNASGTSLFISQCATASPLATQGNFIGAQTGNADFYVGCIDELSIWNVPFTATDIAFVFLQQSSSLLPAIACSSFPIGDYSDCFKYRQTCHFVLASDSCVSGPPATCAQYLTDSTGCSANSSCVVKGSTGECINAPQVCSLVTSQSVCSQYSNCFWVSGACIAATTTCSSITGPTGATACAAAGCYWDFFIGQCFETLAEVIAENACATWSYFPIPNVACAAHGCSLSSDGLTCSTPGVGAGNVTAMVTDWSVQFVSPQMSTTNTTFYVQVWLPNALKNWPAEWYYITIGNQFPGYSMARNLVPNSGCNDIGDYNATVGPPIFIPVSNPAGLISYYDNWVTTGHNFTFSSADSNGATLYLILGNVSIAQNSLTTVVSSVGLDASLQYNIFQVAIDINNIVAKCNSLGASVFITPGNLLYTLPISVIRRTSTNTYSAQGVTFYVKASLTGVIQGLSASSRYQPVGYQQEISIVTTNCPAGQGRMNIVYSIQYQNVFSPGIFVGPRIPSDVNFTTPANPIFGGLNNCFQEQVVYVNRLYTVGSVSYTVIETQTNCRQLTTDGQAFVNCSYAQPADIASDLGSSTAVYQSRLNKLHDFYITAYSCPSTSLVDGNFSQCVLAVVSTANYPDYFPSTINLLAYPATFITYAYDVFAGLLPTPFTTDLTQIEQLVQSPNVQSNVQDLTNSNLFWNGQLTFVIGIVSPNIRLIANLTFATEKLFTIVGLDPFGVPITGLPTLHIQDIFPYMTYVPKSLLAQCTSSACLNTPATANQRAYDSFSIPVITLRALLPANGYSISTAYVYTLETGALAVREQLQFYRGTTRQLFSVREKPAKTKRRSSSRFRVEAPTTPAPLTNGNEGAYDLGFSVDDVSNPAPPSLYLIGNTTYAHYSNTTLLIPAAQCAIKLCVLAQAVAGSPFLNVTFIKARLTQRIPLVVSQTLGIDIRQVLYVTPTSVQHNNSIDFTDLPCTYITPHSLASKHSGFQLAAAPTTQVAFYTVYVSFVLIAAPNATLTAAQLAANLTSPTTTAVLEYYIGLLGAQLTLSLSSLTVNVIIIAPPFYFNLTNGLSVTITTTTTEAPVSASALALGWIVGIVLFGSLFFIVCVMCCLLSDASTAISTRRRRQEEERAEQQRDEEPLNERYVYDDAGVIAPPVLGVESAVVAQRRPSVLYPPSTIMGQEGIASRRGSIAPGAANQYAIRSDDLSKVEDDDDEFD